MRKLFLAFLLVGCASAQVPFQKLDNGIGYEIENKGADTFIVKASLPSDVEKKSYNRYIARVAGEECSQRGFDYFDYTDVLNSESQGFCYKENKRRALGVSFDRTKMDAQPAEFVIDNLNSKSNTGLKLQDKVLKVNDHTIQHVGEIKKLSHEYNLKKVDKVKIEIIRDGKVMKLDEPLAEMSNGNYGPQDLALLRKKYL